MPKNKANLKSNAWTAGHNTALYKLLLQCHSSGEKIPDTKSVKLMAPIFQPFTAATVNTKVKALVKQLKKSGRVSLISMHLQI